MLSLRESADPLFLLRLPTQCDHWLEGILRFKRYDQIVNNVELTFVQIRRKWFPKLIVPGGTPGKVTQLERHDFIAISKILLDCEFAKN